MKPLPQNYDHKETEARWQKHWLERGTYHWDESAPRSETYVIDTPPPTVSGHLHMGHIFSYTQADFVARWQRMMGKSVFYPMGFDDNGLPTERLVEKATKKRASDYPSREAFIEACTQISEEARAAFRTLFQSTALSVDWRQEYHTISPDSRRISQLSFLDLYSKKAVERRLEPMLWDPIDQTAIAQAEVVDQELASSFNDIAFGIEGSDEKITIATTRPELIPACVGVFYHPEDERYNKKLAGKKAITPLFGVKVPIYADPSVEIEKGTGLMMCCTFGDEKDIEKWRKYNLPMRVLLNRYGKVQLEIVEHPNSRWISFVPIPSNISGSTKSMQGQALIESFCVNMDTTIHYVRLINGLKATAARAKILELLAESGDLLDSKPITHAVKCAERSGAPLEILPTPQWFVKVMDIKDELKARSAACNWHPEWMQVRMEQWIDGLNWDWCISRQRYYGVPFPVWYSKRPGEEGKVLLAEANQLPVNPLTNLPRGYSRDEVEPDVDVMDTWATSSVSPQINAGSLLADTDRAKKLFPADLRPQAHEIIRTWAFYTLVKAHYHNDSVPWKNLMISGWCLAEDKTKMSKSKGNVVTPIDLIEEHGADVVRYWASTSRLGQDTAFSRDLLKIGKKLVNKLWNATKFAAIHLEKEPGEVTATLDRWILTRLHRTVAKATYEFERYEYAAARAAIEDFFWKDFCDNYLELIKKRVYDEAGNDPEGQASAVRTIALCLDAILRLFAPFLPHVTEELWSHIFPESYAKAGSIHARSTWPKAADYLADEAADDAGRAVVEILEAVRKAKSEKGVSIKWPIESMTITAVIDCDLILSDDIQQDLMAAGNIKTIHWKEPAGLLSNSEPVFHSSFVFAEQSDAA